MTDTTCPDLIPVRMLNEYAYCPRLFALEWLNNEWADNTDTARGRRGLQRPPQAGEGLKAQHLQLVEHAVDGGAPRVAVPQGLEALLRSLLGKRAGEKDALALPAAQRLHQLAGVRGHLDLVEHGRHEDRPGR